MNEKIKRLCLLILVLILMAINIYIYLINNKTSNQKSNQNNVSTNQNVNSTVASNEEVTNALESKIADMGERTRMQTYYGQFINLVETGKYDEAYEKLNKKFKTNYFPSVDKFKEYVVSKYPKNIRLVYTNIDRQGEYYILTVTVYDSFDENYQSFQQTVVVKENGNNDYEISFQVIQ